MKNVFKNIYIKLPHHNAGAGFALTFRRIRVLTIRIAVLYHTVFFVNEEFRTLIHGYSSANGYRFFFRSAGDSISLIAVSSYSPLTVMRNNVLIISSCHELPPFDFYFFSGYLCFDCSGFFFVLCFLHTKSVAGYSASEKVSCYLCHFKQQIILAEI